MATECGWIDVQERYPMDGERVLTIDSKGFIDVYSYDLNYPWFFWRPDKPVKVANVTHWMPLPEPPNK